MSNVATYEDLKNAVDESFIEDVRELLGGFNTTYDALIDLGSSAYDLEDEIADGDIDLEDGLNDSHGYVESAEFFFSNLDKLNDTVSRLRDRVLVGIDEEYEKLTSIIEYRDQVVQGNLEMFKSELSEDDYGTLNRFLRESEMILSVSSLRNDYETVLSYVNKLDDTLKTFNEFGDRRNHYKTDLYTPTEIDRVDDRFYYQHEQFNPLSQFSVFAEDVYHYVTLVNRLLQNNYGISIDDI